MGCKDTYFFLLSKFFHNFFQYFFIFLFWRTYIRSGLGIIKVNFASALDFDYICAFFEKKTKRAVRKNIFDVQ